MNRITNHLSKDIFILSNEDNPSLSDVSQIYPSTTIDQVFDQETPTHTTLREIIEGLRHDILTGGQGNIKFPVTSVNGLNGDVIITKNKVGLGNVNNTSDMNKPLSDPQRAAIEAMLSSYNFNINLSPLTDHLLDFNNPHHTTITQLNENGEVDDVIQSLIDAHNTNTSGSTHLDIRHSLGHLWNYVETFLNGFDDKVSGVFSGLDTHYNDPNAHLALLALKENLSNKAMTFDDDTINNTMYPTTQAVVELMSTKIEPLFEMLDVVNIRKIALIEDRSLLPEASFDKVSEVYFIRHGIGSENEIAICKKNNNNVSYDWDIKGLGSYSKFNEEHFLDGPQGLSIKLSAIIDNIIGEGYLDITQSQLLQQFYTKFDSDNRYLSEIDILPGTMDGTIRYFINGDQSTMTTDIDIPGLQTLAFKEFVTEFELNDESVHERHILTKAVTHDKLDDQAVSSDKMACSYAKLLGNVNNENSNEAHEIDLVSLSDVLRPLIGGWPDPNVPGENPWLPPFREMLVSPHLWTPLEEMNLRDGSFAMRFTGTISCPPNVNHSQLLSSTIKLDGYNLLDAGGSWFYSTSPKLKTILSGANITGFTFGTITMSDNGVYFQTISEGDRMGAGYDIWIRYTSPESIYPIP